MTHFVLGNCIFLCYHIADKFALFQNIVFMRTYVGPN